VTNVNYKGNRNLLLTGSEDGRLVAWDMNSQKVLASRQMSSDEKLIDEAASESPAKVGKMSAVIRSLDCSNGIVAMSNGNEETGVKVFSLESLLESESQRSHQVY